MEHDDFRWTLGTSDGGAPVLASVVRVVEGSFSLYIFHGSLTPFYGTVETYVYGELQDTIDYTDDDIFHLMNTLQSRTIKLNEEVF